MYRRNLLIQRDKLKIKNVPIDIEQIDLPTYFLSTRDDHIAPWVATYAGARALKNANVTFTLAASGHVAGVVNPPDAKKYSYWTAHKLPADHEKWLESAQMQPGSWWPHWRQWLTGIDSYVRRKAV
jgi:polyhydroxyalkanoate synthase